MGKFSHTLLLSVVCYSQGFAVATDTKSLDDSLKALSSFDFGNSIELTNQVRAANANPDFTFADKDFTIDGKGFKLNGDAKFRGFFIGASGANKTKTVTIQNLNFDNCQAIGGTGGGGGLGAGGAIFVGEDTKAVLQNCSFQKCQAIGGNGNRSTPGRGGGGLHGDGGSVNDDGGAGGGFGGSGDISGGGASGFVNASGTTPGPNFNNTPSGAGSGVGGLGAIGAGGINGGYGGGGGFGGQGDGGEGDTFGGGGSTGKMDGNAGIGGFGGGGGGGNSGGGNGGFGAGGGSGPSSGSAGLGGFGGGDGTLGSPTGISGLGAGYGGAIFLAKGADLTISGSAFFLNNFAESGRFGNLNMDANSGFGELGQDIFMMSESILTFDITSNVFLQNPIQGNQGNQFPEANSDTTKGGLTKKGSARLGLIGENTYTGTTTVSEGVLDLGGSLVSNVVIDAGGALSGIFTLKPDFLLANGGTLDNSGLFNPGPQTTIELGYTNETSGKFLVDITPTGTVADKTFVIGNADIKGGELQIFVGSGSYIKGTQYILITGDVTGAGFDNQSDPTLLGPNAENVKVEVTTGSLILTVTENHFFPIILPLNPDDPSNPLIPILTQQVALCLQASDPPPGSDLALVIESLGTLSFNQSIKALQTLSARLFGSLEWINERNNSYSADLLHDHLSELYWDCDCSYQGWVTGFGNLMNNQKKLDNLPKYNADSAGILAGVDYTPNSCFTTGLAFGYTRTHVLWRNDGGGGNTDSYYGALYGDYESECFGIELSVLGGGTFNDMRRHIDFANVDRTARSDYWSYFFTGHLQIEPFRFTSYADHCIAHFEPFATADYHYYTHETFSEKGANSLNLRIKSKTQHFMRGEAGIKWNYEVCCDCYTYSPYLGVSWVGEFPLGKSRQPASFIGQSCVINALSYKSDVHLGSGEVGLRFAHCNGASFQLGYKGLFNSSVRINEIEGRFEYVF